jgi:sporulation protein YlmC with PRC-barrel domain
LREQRNGDCGIVFSLHLLAKEEHMLARTVTAALASTALLATIASAQTPPATTDRADKATSSSTASATTLSSSQVQGDWRASKVVGLSVYNDNNEKLGSINDLLMDKSGNIKAVVLGVGGFLGMGEHLVAVPLEKVKFSSEPIAYTGTASTGAGGGTATRPASPPTTPTTTTGSATTAPAAKSNPWYPDHAVFNANKDELKSMSEFKYTE